MHEASIAQSILKIAQKRSVQIKKSRIKTIKVEIGEFRNVDFDSLQFAFDNLKNVFVGCEETQLQAKLISAIALCDACSKQYHPNIDAGFRCVCDGGIKELIAGEELSVYGIILEVNDEVETTYA